MPPLPKDSNRFEIFDQQIWNAFAFPPRTSMKRKRRNIRFQDHTLCYRHITLSDYTESEIKDCWYTNEEYSEFAIDVSKAVENVKLHHGNSTAGENGATGNFRSDSFGLNKKEESKVQDDIENTLRGAECRLEHVTERRRRIRAHARGFVLEAQTKEGSSERINSEWISEVYNQISQENIHEALILASSDQEEADNIFAESDDSFWSSLYMLEWAKSLLEPEPEPDLITEAPPPKADEKWTQAVFV